MALHCTNTYTHANAHDMHGCHDVTHTGVDHQPGDQTDQTIENTMDLVTHGNNKGSVATLLPRPRIKRGRSS